MQWQLFPTQYHTFYVNPLVFVKYFLCMRYVCAVHRDKMQYCRILDRVPSCRGPDRALCVERTGAGSFSA
jgi:hypothetical protein